MKDYAKPPKKILVLGPCKAGKTVISNYLGEQVDVESLGDYRPTKGVRIVEFESHELEIRKQRIEVDVELWDCSGDLKYRDCWPALRDGIQGVILVANPDENQGEDLNIWDYPHSGGAFNEVDLKSGKKGCSDFRLEAELKNYGNLQAQGACRWSSLKKECRVSPSSDMTR